MQYRRGSAAITTLFVVIAASFILGGILLVGAANTANPCVITSQGINPCPITTITTSSSGTVTTVTSTSSTPSSTTSTTTAYSSTTTQAPNTAPYYVSAQTVSSGSGCNAPTGPYPSYCNNVPLTVSVTADGANYGFTPTTVYLSTSGSHTISCGQAAGYQSIQTTFTVSNSNPNQGTYVTCTYQSPPYNGSTTPLTVTVLINGGTVRGTFPSSGDTVTLVCPPPPASVIYSAAAVTNSQGQALFNAPQNISCQASDTNVYGTQTVTFSIGTNAPSVTLTFTLPPYGLVTIPIIGPVSISNAQAVGYGLMVGGVIAFVAAFSMGRGRTTRHR